MPVKIVIADDHDVVRQGMRAILRARPDWEVSAEAANGQEAIDAVRRHCPDVLILDITMPVMSGLDAMREIGSLQLPTCVLIFTMHDSPSLIRAVREGGAKGYVLKSNAARDLIKAIEALLGGGSFFGSEYEKPGDKIEDKNKGLSFFAALRSLIKPPCNRATPYNRCDSVVFQL
jgi:DNA-binding NarL/FixJ family response regulator